MSDSEEDKKPAATVRTNVASAATNTDAANATASYPAAATTPTRAKPALKKKDKAKAKHDKRLKWDEQKIKEHDELRGTRMKIDEPNTPYLHYSDSSEGAESDDSRPHPKSPAQQKVTLSWDTLQNKLDSVAAVQHISFPDSPSHPTHEGRRNEMRRLEFKEHRKRHYNEFERVKKFRQEHPHDADVEDGNVSDDE